MSSIAPASFQRAVGSQINNDNNALAVRVAVVALAGAILFARMPHSFLRPQFWGEDAIVFLDNYVRGARAIFDPLGGYPFAIPRLIALFAGMFPVWMAPWIYNYAALAAVLALVALVMSPRFDLPYKPLLALAVVVGTAGSEVLLTLVNVQWIAPVGVMVLLLMREAHNRAVRWLENSFVAITALTGPFSIFIFPISLCLYLIERRRRLLEFSIVLALGAAIQATFIGSNLNLFNLIEPKPYHWSLWITAPNRRVRRRPLFCDFGVHHGLHLRRIIRASCCPGAYSLAAGCYASCRFTGSSRLRWCSVGISGTVFNRHSINGRISRPHFCSFRLIGAMATRLRFSTLVGPSIMKCFSIVCLQ
jgi:hypothetical protein